VQDHPEWETCFHLAVQWERLLADARSLADPEKDDEVLPYAVASDKLPESARHRSLRTAFNRIFRRAEVNSHLQSLLNLYRNRKNAIDSITNAATHFESVTGHSVRPDDSDERSNIRRRPPYGLRSVTAISRAPVGRSFLRATGMLVGVYALLFIASMSRDTPMERMAHLRTSDFTWTELGVSVRGDDTEWGRLLIARYEEALAVAASSQKTFLGLFPTYRNDRLQHARALLQGTMDLQSERESAPVGALITLAKFHFLLGDSTESLDALREAVILNQTRSALPNNPAVESGEINEASKH